MSELDLYAKYLDLGVRLGRSGEDLSAWVEDKVRHDMERSDRQIERERRREEMELQKHIRMELQKQREEMAFQREEREMQNQREEKESQRQLELRRLELEAETKKLEIGSRNNADGAGPRPSYFTQRPKIPPLPDPSQVDLYLERFERHATAFGWPESEWASCLSNLLQDEALSIFLSLSPAEGSDYQAVKRALLQRFGCDRNGFRSKFLSVKPQEAEDFGTFINRAMRYFDRWVELSGVSTLEGLSYLVCLEIALQACDEDFVAYVKDHSPSDMVALKTVASAYMYARPNKSFHRKRSISFAAKSEPYRSTVRVAERKDDRSIWSRPHGGSGRIDYSSKRHRSPSFQSSSNIVKRGASRSPSRDRSKSNVASKNVGQGHFRPSSSSGSGLASSHSNVTCFQCGGRGHVRCECPSRPKEANSASLVPELPSHCCAAKMDCNPRGGLKIESCKVFDRVSTLLRDSACNTTTGGPFFKTMVSACWITTSCWCIFSYRGWCSQTANAKSKFSSVQTTIAVPESLRQVVLSYAHESDLSGHSGFRKTLSAIRDYFYWPHVCSDVKNYTSSCYLCQIKPRTGRDRPAPFQQVPIVGEPFERVVIDLVGPLPVSSDKYEYLLTLVDVSTRWAEAVPLRRITAKDVAEALFSIFTRLGFPKEIQSDRGQQFMSNLLAEFNSLCDIKHFVSTPYHPQTNGIVERFHSTLKSIIRKLSHESPSEWSRFVPAALFAYRGQVHSSTGFSPFYLLFGRAPRGPMQILSDVFLNKNLSRDTSFQYQYVIDLHNRIRKGWRVAQESVRDSASESRLRHEPKSRLKHFMPGDEVLVLLPTSDNKLVLSYKGPYTVVEKRSGVVYLVDLGDRKCTFHVNLLRKYKRSTCPPPPSDDLVGVDGACSGQAFAGATSLCDPFEFPFSSLRTIEPPLSINNVLDGKLNPIHDSSLKFCDTICFAEPTAYVSAISEEDGGEIGSLVATPPLASENGTVVIDPSLSASQVQDVKELLLEFQDILTSAPGCTNTLCHEIRLTTDDVIRVKPYPLPFAARDFVTQEVNDLLSLGVIEPSDSPYCFPIVVVKKKDGSMRLCIDFRKLNAVTVFDAENIPRQEDLFNQLSHATIFSSCDLCKAYW
ncbi:gypsy retrotransposon integrase-like protein 1 [Plakobranchus ocellatus]|uniref:Gypsy retrotransposon integrase-like protein 1 n=1 Tax=Plakobranchus ocellatus TaxID=259542 RepID=A0AAV4B2B9_9GAST|nr:gypsy retrotransposon integrase-like protein 1 [Plakobranchus ocellatus]